MVPFFSLLFILDIIAIIVVIITGDLHLLPTLIASLILIGGLASAHNKIDDLQKKLDDSTDKPSEDIKSEK
jgi:hypothetical protein